MTRAPPQVRTALQATARDLGPAGRFHSQYIEVSPCAMSPEQFRGDVLTLQSDVWQVIRVTRLDVWHVGGCGR